MQKKEIHLQCVQQVEEKLDRLQALMDSAQKASNDDTKSSAGDKYETGRAMMQAEKDKAMMQVAEVSKMRKVLSEMDYSKTLKTIELGTLVTLNLGVFYFSVALGEIKVGTDKYFAISPVSPIGKMLAGKSKGDHFTFNGREVQILDLC